MKTKRCNNCREVKELNQFALDPNYKHTDGRSPRCKQCINTKVVHNWTTIICKECGVAKTYDEFNNSKYGKHGKASKCKECISRIRISYKVENEDYIKARNRKNYSKVKDRINKQNRKRRKEDPIYKLKGRVRYAIYRYIKDKGGRSSIDILGCEIDKLKEHLTEQFSEGMTWDNHGEWHIDHIIPLSSANTKEEVIKLNHYTNLQPLWAKDNLSKGAKQDWNQE